MHQRILSSLLFGLLIISSGLAQERKFFGSLWQRGEPASYYTDYFNQITPENAGKWGNVDYNQLDQMFDYADENNLITKQHTFVWGQQTRSGATKQQVEDWISGYMERYPQVHLIDVVNEALPGHAQPDYKNNLGGDGASGWDWVLWTFATARKYAPDAKLLINDYNILSSSNSTNQYSNFIKVIQSEGNIDGIGCQAHFLENASANTVKSNLDKLAELGLPIYISEFDLDIANDQQHLAKMQEIFPVFWEHPMVGGVTVWGHVQGTMWRTNGWLMDRNGNERAAMTWLKQYIADNPLPPPPEAGEVPIIRFSQTKAKAPSQLIFSDQLNVGVLSNQAAIYTLDGQRLDAHTQFDISSQGRIPLIVAD